MIRRRLRRQLLYSMHDRRFTSTIRNPTNGNSVVRSDTVHGGELALDPFRLGNAVVARIPSIESERNARVVYAIPVTLTLYVSVNSS